MTKHTDELEKRTKKIREQMGSKSRLEKMEREGKPNIRQHIDAILDEGTFQEIGTFSRSLREDCLLYTSPSPRDGLLSRMPSSA